MSESNLGWEISQLWQWCSDRGIELTITTAGGGRIYGSNNAGWAVSYALADSGISPSRVRRAFEYFVRTWKDA